MPTSPYNTLTKCKLCGSDSIRPTYRLKGLSILVCRQCDFHFSDHLDGPAMATDTSAALNDGVRSYLDRRRDEGDQQHAARFALLQTSLDLNGARCLDIGAGLGQFQLLLEKHGATVLGIEPSPLRCAYARERFGIRLYSELVENAFWQQDYATAFDLITLWDTLEHVDFPRETLSAAVRLLKPGGFLAVETPSRQVAAYRLSERLYHLSRGRISLFLANFYTQAPFGHKQIFTPCQLDKLLNSLGLAISPLSESAPARHRARQLIRVARKPAN